jgi:hypothetical protein
MDFKGGGALGAFNSSTALFCNSYYNGTNYIYKASTSAGFYQIAGNQHQWYNAASGTAGNTITFTQAMTLDASGRLGIGSTSPDRKLTLLVSPSTAGDDGYKISDGTRASTFARTGATYSYQGVGVNSTLLYSSNTLCLLADGSSVLSFHNGNGETARIDSSGNLLVGTTSANGTWKTQINQSSGNALIIAGTGNDVLMLRGSVASSSSSSLASFFSDNVGGTNYSSGTLRFNFTSNGGLANYQANDSNLSDRREKTNFAPAGEYLSKICSIPVQTYNYIDQNLEEDGGLTLGVVAQDVQAVAPELVTEADWSSEKDGSKMRLSVFQTDLQYALMKCIQEQQALITTLTARITALESA